MIEKKHYSVLVSGIPEHERLIFKLIFSVSQKSKSCVNAYALVDPGNQAQTDVLITGSLEAQNAGAWPYMSSKATVIVADRASAPDGNIYLPRPLVATRVLSLLDKVVERLNETDTTVIGIEDRSHSASMPLPGNEGPVETGAESSSDSSDSFDFDISEDDAYKIAIVQDDALANPANREYGYLAPAEADTSRTQDIPTDRSADTTSVQAVDEGPGETGGSERSDAPCGNWPADGAVVSATDGSYAGDAHECANTAEPIPEARRKALVVDDSASVRKQLELELALFAVDVDYAANAGDALALLTNRRYDVAFLDVVLPDMDGFQICKSIKSMDKNTAVVMLTAKSSAADKVKGSLAGCDAYLVKPVGRLTFQSTAMKYLTMHDTKNVTQERQDTRQVLV